MFSFHATRKKMPLLAKFTKYVSNSRCLPQWQRTVYTSVKSHCKIAPEDEKTKQEFRILQIMPGKETDKDSKGRGRRLVPIHDENLPENVDWTNVWVGPKTFDPRIVPMPLKQGYTQTGEPPGKYANVELMKIPNFLHLTPPAIQKHCAALKKFCTEWPTELKTEADMEKYFPITVTVSDYCHSSPSIRDPLSRIVILKVKLDALGLDKHARDKFLRLAGDCYNPKTGYVFITAKNCPLKKQNYDHAMYILTALCFESWRMDEWEKLKTIEDLAEYCFDLRQTKANVDAYFDYTGKPHQPLEKMSEILEEYISDNKESDLIGALKDEVMKLLNLPKFKWESKVDSAQSDVEVE